MALIEYNISFSVCKKMSINNSEMGEIPSCSRSFLNPESFNGLRHRDENQFQKLQEEVDPEQAFSGNITPSHDVSSVNQEIPQLNITFRADINMPEIHVPQMQPSLGNQSVSYLNISFQEILNILLNNEMPILTHNLRKVVRTSSFILFALLVYTSVELILEITALYDTLYGSDEYRMNRLSSAYFFLKALSDSLLLYSLLEMRYIVQDSYITQGEISTQIINYLEHVIKHHSPFEEQEDDEEEDNNLSQAQWVARSIAAKIDTSCWINYLASYHNARLYSINRLILFTQFVLFVWGNSLLIQEHDLHKFNSVVIFYSLMPGYFGALALSLSLLFIFGSIPIMLCLILWQSFYCCAYWARQLVQGFRNWHREHMRRKFIQSLREKPYSDITGPVHDEVCAICLAQYSPQDMVIRLPCGQGQEAIDHHFHSQCIRIWVEEQGNCPICRKRFIRDNDV